MRVRATDHRRHARAAALAPLLVAGLGGCVTQEYVRGLGYDAAKGAMGGVADSIPAIEEPLRQTLRRALVDDETLRRAARDMTETAVKSLEAGLASAEMRKQIDDLVTQALESTRRNGDEAIRRLIQTAEPELKEALHRAATEGLESASAKLRERIERDLTPATERLARRTGEQLILKQRGL